MTAWKLLYENRFPTTAGSTRSIPDSYRAAEGEQSVESGVVILSFSGIPGFGIGDGRNLTYRPSDSLQNVIGMDVAIEFAPIRISQGQEHPLFSCDPNGLSLTLSAEEPPATEFQKLKLTIKLDGLAKTIDSVTFRIHRQFPNQELQLRRLRLRWTTNGQLHLWLDDNLIAYENAVQAGTRYKLDTLTIGDASRPNSGRIEATLTSFRFAELRENSSGEALGEQLDPALPDIDERCEKAAQHALNQLMRDARQLMAGFNQSQTSPWRIGDAGTPFKAASVSVHEAGKGAGNAFARYLREESPEARQEVASHLETLLQHLAADQPILFRNLIEKAAETRKSLNQHCKKAAKEARNINTDLLKKLDPLGKDIQEIIHSLTGDS